MLPNAGATTEVEVFTPEIRAGPESARGGADQRRDGLTRYSSARRAVFDDSNFQKIFYLGRFLSDPTSQDGFANGKAIMTNDQQLELGFGGGKPETRKARRENRLARAAWWFNKMRTVVNNAMDWPPAGPPRPQQTWLPGAYRQVRI